ncbi:hypothetical protein B0H19DRAFT_1184108 [Mycena capillaripes]|nr:hypothetical protein B0H19DRAFT_1184108 [Mycena capillaripes]
MHRCLNVPEIVNMVCSELDPDVSLDSVALANLARTSSVFHSQALDVLWRRRYQHPCPPSCAPHLPL